MRSAVGRGVDSLQAAHQALSGGVELTKSQSLSAVNYFELRWQPTSPEEGSPGLLRAASADSAGSWLKAASANRCPPEGGFSEALHQERLLGLQWGMKVRRRFSPLHLEKQSTCLKSKSSLLFLAF